VLEDVTADELVIVVEFEETVGVGIWDSEVGLEDAPEVDVLIEIDVEGVLLGGM